MNIKIKASLVCTSAFALSVWMCGSSEAMVLSGGIGSSAPANDTAPTDDPGWERVGVRGIGTGVYLGEGWVITAKHVGGAGNFSVDGTTYSAVAGSSVVLTNGDGSDADLLMFQIDVPVSSPLASVPLVAFTDTTPTLGDEAIAIGTGFTQNSATPDHNHGGGLANDGYTYNTLRDKKWSEFDIVAPLDLGETAPAELELDDFFFTRFLPTGDSALAVHRDSGSPIFVKNEDDEWALAGLVHSILPAKDQAENTAVYGNYNIWSDFSVSYKDQILATIPEPASLGILAALVAPVAACRRRRA
ncbi:trypsin-like serine protease [Planctomycetota bacterium]|nr:trypsin-like serine protease [Planctomycetota bacterium]